VAAAIANAVEDAVGVRIKSLPISPEKILEAFQLNFFLLIITSSKYCPSGIFK